MNRKDKSKRHSKIFKDIGKDHLSGASELSRKTAKAFEIYAEVVDAKNPSEYFKKLLELSKDLISYHLFITPIFNLSNLILSSLSLDASAEQKRKDSTVPELKKLTKNLAKDFYEKSFLAEDKIGEIGQNLIKNDSVILTNSFSSSVFSILKRARSLDASAQKRKKIKVRVLESRPLYEGRNLAKKLGNLGIDVTLIVDSAMGLFIKDADFVLVGADCVSERFFVNKIGTHPLALLAKNKKIPLYVASEKSKFIPEKYRFKSTHQGEITEVYEKKLLNVKVENPYFEEIPISWCERIITEDGLLMPGEVSKLIRKIKVSKELMNKLAW